MHGFTLLPFATLMVAAQVFGPNDAKTQVNITAEFNAENSPYWNHYDIHAERTQEVLDNFRKWSDNKYEAIRDPNDHSIIILRNLKKAKDGKEANKVLLGELDVIDKHMNPHHGKKLPHPEPGSGSRGHNKPSKGSKSGS